MSYNHILKIGNHHNEIIEIGMAKSRKPIVITRPDADGINLAERICLAVNKTSFLSLEELRQAEVQIVAGPRRLERLVLWVDK